jgi:hypothetical protein
MPRTRKKDSGPLADLAELTDRLELEMKAAAAESAELLGVLKARQQALLASLVASRRQNQDLLAKLRARAARPDAPASDTHTNAPNGAERSAI